MEYLGEFLSPNNSIALDQDKLTKYFYFRPDIYEDPDADLENIFKIKEMTEFPKRLDLLSENTLYAVDTIEVSKRVSDEEVGVKKVSYVVTATYDLLENIRKRESSDSGDEEEESGEIVDEDGNVVTSETPPWKIRAKWDFQPVELTVPFLKGYLQTGNQYWSSQVVDVLNSAKCRLLAETKKFQYEITYTKAYESAQSGWEQLTRAYINSDDFDIDADWRGDYPSGTLLILPPSFSVDWYEKTTTEGQTTIKSWERYYTYTVKMIYDPDGHAKTLLDVGTYALFGEDPVPRQIWEVTKVDSETGSIIAGYPKWVSAAEALRDQAQSLRDGQLITAAPITEPVPLTAAGTIDEAAIKDPYTNRYRTLTYLPYAGRPFANLPWKI